MVTLGLCDCSHKSNRSVIACNEYWHRIANLSIRKIAEIEILKDSPAVAVICCRFFNSEIIVSTARTTQQLALVGVCGLWVVANNAVKL